MIAPSAKPSVANPAIETPTGVSAKPILKLSTSIEPLVESLVRQIN